MAISRLGRLRAKPDRSLYRHFGSIRRLDAHVTAVSLVKEQSSWSPPLAIIVSLPPCSILVLQTVTRDARATSRRFPAVSTALPYQQDLTQTLLPSGTAREMFVVHSSGLGRAQREARTERRTISG